jgi:hypothetical protein
MAAERRTGTSLRTSGIHECPGRGVDVAGADARRSPGHTRQFGCPVGGRSEPRREPIANPETSTACGSGWLPGACAVVVFGNPPVLLRPMAKAGYTRAYFWVVPGALCDSAREGTTRPLGRPVHRRIARPIPRPIMTGRPIITTNARISRTLPRPMRSPTKGVKEWTVGSEQCAMAAELRHGEPAALSGLPEIQTIAQLRAARVRARYCLPAKART